ncbi:RabGAP/TBC [Amylocystis lapponica]|nr:RabGAP/TBC [Amylocystis lapponica]
MSSPSFAVVPPTPLHSSRLSLSPLSTTATTTATTTAASVPELSPGDPDRDRSSSETTIVTIYSMYEEDVGSWSAPESVAGHRHHPSKDIDINVGVGVDVTIAGVHKDSFLQPNGSPVEDSAYYEATSDWQRSSRRISVVDKPRQSTLSSNGSVQLAYSDSRPSSSHARVSGGTEDLRRRSSLDRDEQPRTSQSRLSSRGHRSVSSQKTNGVVNASSPTPFPPVRSTSHPPPSQSPPLPASSRPQSLLQLPYTPPSSPPRRPSQSSTPESKHSAVPSEGEDPDGFHVRSTYAQLEVCGVKGDGYDEGVERTRARVGGSRASELRALQALDDGSEKTRDLTEQEQGLLASLDRYGFYVTPSHDRLILLPAVPLQKPLVHLATAPTKAPPSPPLLRAHPPAPPPPKETVRTEKWGRMLEAQSRDQGQNIDSWGIKPSKEHKLSERTFKGIPDRWRAAAWETLICRFAKLSKTGMRKYMDEYREALEQPSSYDVQIDLDVPRTISGHVMFRTRYGQGQRSLFHVLHSLSLCCETCGYCQGMGPIAATLLCYFEPERAYAALVLLHDSYSMHTIFSPGFPGLLEAIYVQERVTEQMLPVVYAAFKKHMISTTSYATKWYITLFANSVPFQTQLRLWDAFLLEGHDLFVIVAVAIVWVFRDHITSEAASFETVLSLLSSFFVPEDENALLAWIEKVISDKKLRAQMRQWREEWNRLVAEDKHNQALL